MAQATTTTAGEIVLSGDLAGSDDANFPELRASGVTPGYYPLIQRATFDTKGRAVSVGSLNWVTELAPMLTTATATSAGIFLFGNGLTETGGGINANTASSSVSGIFKPGLGTRIVNNTLQIVTSDIPASSTSLGFIRVGSGFNLTNSVLSIQDATTTEKGVFSLGVGLTATTGNVSLDLPSLIPTSNVFGFVKTGNGFTNNAGTISLDISSATVYGLIQVGANFDLTDNILSLNNATTSVKGVFSINTGLISSSGVITGSAFTKKGVANSFTKAQNGIVGAQSSTTITPNFVSGPSLTEVTLTGATTIQFPTVLAPPGTLVEQTFILTYSESQTYSVSLNSAYSTNRGTLPFTNLSGNFKDVLTLLCTDSMCFAILNDKFL